MIEQAGAVTSVTDLRHAAQLEARWSSICCSIFSSRVIPLPFQDKGIRQRSTCLSNGRFARRLRLSGWSVVVFAWINRV